MAARMLPPPGTRTSRLSLGRAYRADIAQGLHEEGRAQAQQRSHAAGRQGLPAAARRRGRPRVRRPARSRTANGPRPGCSRNVGTPSRRAHLHLRRGGACGRPGRRATRARHDARALGADGLVQRRLAGPGRRNSAPGTPVTCCRWASGCRVASVCASLSAYPAGPGTVSCTSSPISSRRAASSNSTSPGPEGSS